MTSNHLTEQKSLKILVAWSGRPGYVPPPNFSEDQITIFSHHDRKLPGTLNPPRLLADVHNYDLGQVSQKILNPEEVDLVIVSCNSGPDNKVTNLEAFNCPKILMLTDTHHISAEPISVVLDYYRGERFDAVVSLYNRDHLKWFRAESTVRLGWHPGLTVSDIPREFADQREQNIAFIGNWQRQHPLRKRYLDRLVQDGFPIKIEKLNRMGCAVRYSTSLLSFNCSLNGDLNMRIFEVLSSGGCLVTDRLAPASGLSELLVEGEHYIGYSSYAELKEKLQYYLARPERAIDIARAGLAVYQQKLSANLLSRRFVSWALGLGHPECDYCDAIIECDDLDPALRLQIYQLVLTEQLRGVRIKVLGIGTKAAACLDDLRGIFRCDRALIRVNGHHQTSDPELELIDQQTAVSAQWDMVIIDRAEQNDYNAQSFATNHLRVI